MKKWPLVAALVLLAILALWLGMRTTGASGPAEDEATRRPDTAAFSGTADHSAGGRATKASTRMAGARPATHGPARLREFYLPAVDVQGLTLSAALEKLRVAYEQACRESGESPVALGFELPPGTDPVIRLKLGPGSLDGMIRMLAAVAGLQTERDGAVFRFEHPAGDVSGSDLRVAPDILSRLAAMAGREFPPGTGPKERLEALGLALDPATRIAFNPGNSTIDMGSTSPADQLRVVGFLKSLLNDTPVQHKLDTKVLTIPAGVDWTPPDRATLDGEGVQLLLRELSQKKGVDLLTTPSIVGRSGENAVVEIGPLKLDITPDLLGFGETLDVTFTETDRSIDSASGMITLEERNRVDFSGFTGDGDTRVKVQKHPDGSRTVLMVTPTLIDATGRPVRAGE